MQVITTTRHNRTGDISEEIEDFDNDLAAVTYVIQCVSHATWQGANDSRFTTLDVRIVL